MIVAAEVAAGSAAVVAIAGLIAVGLVVANYFDPEQADSGSIGLDSVCSDPDWFALGSIALGFDLDSIDSDSACWFDPALVRFPCSRRKQPPKLWRTKLSPVRESVHRINQPNVSTQFSAFKMLHSSTNIETL